MSAPSSCLAHMPVSAYIGLILQGEKGGFLLIAVSSERDVSDREQGMVSCMIVSFRRTALPELCYSLHVARPALPHCASGSRLQERSPTSGCAAFHMQCKYIVIWTNKRVHWSRTVVARFRCGYFLRRGAYLVYVVLRLSTNACNQLINGCH